jgi:4-diphosphocytidyl-2C-methyl-D-erythritol kinase
MAALVARLPSDRPVFLRNHSSIVTGRGNALNAPTPAGDFIPEKGLVGKFAR